MAEKRIDQVDTMNNPDADADYLMVARGGGGGLRRLLLRLLPVSFDVHDSISDELTTLAGVDRLAVSDEGTPGAPQKYVKLSTLRAFFLDLFDLHDDVPTELTAAANDDRLLISDESEAGDPQKWISVENLRTALAGLKSEKLTTEIALTQSVELEVNHTLGRVPVGFQLRLICKVTQGGFVPGDEIYLPMYQRNAQYGLMIYTVTDSSFKLRIYNSGYPVLPGKGANNAFTVAPANWRLGLSIWG